MARVLINPYSRRQNAFEKQSRALMTLLVFLILTWTVYTWKYLREDSFETTETGTTPATVHYSVIDSSTKNNDNNKNGKNWNNDRNNNNNNNNNNKKKKRKDTRDYRTFKIETPPPKQKHEHTNLDETVANLTLSHPVYKGREKLVKMLLEMYIDVTQIEDSVWEKVPVWDEVTAIHGKNPVIYGLDECEDYRNTVPAIDRRVGVAGMFNTGTNLLAILLQHNCGIPERVNKWGRKKGHGMEWQVPWGKHTPAWYRKKAHVNNFIGEIPEDDMMVAVMVRHPHDWIASMCRHSYTARWKHTKTNCPNLYDGNTVHAKFGPGPSDHASIAHMWNDWNGVYYNATFPRLMVRFEDTVFFPKEVSRRVCSCVGGKLMTPKERDGIFHYVIDSAKTGPGHGPGAKRNGLLDAWIKYGKPRSFTSFQKSDLEFIDQHIHKELMESLDWEGPPLPE